MKIQCTRRVAVIRTINQVLLLTLDLVCTHQLMFTLCACILHIMDQCLSKYYQRGFASALMMSKHSSWAITFNGDHPVSISLCTLVADNMSKGTVFVIHVNTNQVPLKAGVLFHSAQFTDSCPQLSHIMTYFAPPFLPPLA